MIQLSTADIEKQIADYALHFDSLKDDEVEWRFQPPPFVPAFIELMERVQHIPSQAEYVAYYIEENRETLNNEFIHKWHGGSTRQQKKRALTARLERAYPSLVRDVYFLALLRENGVAAVYDSKHDVEGGVDLQVSNAGQTIQVHVFLDSARSKQGRAKKDKRHAFAGKHLDVMLCRENSRRIGEFWLPTLEHVRQVKASLG